MTAITSAAARDVGVIGLGQMGLGIARNLDRNGRLAAMWDVRSIGREGFSGEIEFAPPAAIAARCDVVIFVVPSSREIEACLVGMDGLLSVDRVDQTLVDLTTSHPTDTKRLATLATKHGRRYVDGGMSGGAVGADAGRLSLMLGGDEPAIAHCRSALEAIASRIFHVGASTTGHTMKLIHNMVLHTTFLATCEGARLAEHAGIDLAKTIEVMNAGNARSFITERRFPDHILSGKFDGRSRVSNLAKDLAMAADYARQAGTPGVYGPLTASLLARAIACGMADQDFTRLYLEMDRLLEAQATQPT